MMYRYRAVLKISVLVFSLLCCDRHDPKPEQGKIQLDDTLLSLPEAVSAPAQSGSHGGDNESAAAARISEQAVLDEIAAIYNPVRDTYNPLAAEAIAFTQDLLKSIQTSIFSNQLLMDILDKTGIILWTSDSGSEKIQVSALEQGYVIELWEEPGSWVKVLDMRFTKEQQRYAGTIYARDLKGDAYGSPLYRLTFDTEDPGRGHLMELRAANLDSGDASQDSAKNIPAALWLEVSQDNSTFYMSGNISYTNVAVAEGSAFYPYLMSILSGGKDFVDGETSVAANYIYRGAVVRADNRGAVDLALAPASDNSTDGLFESWSVAALYREAIAEWIRAGTLDGEALTEVLNRILSRADSDITVSPDSTTQEIFDALEDIKSHLADRSANTDDIDNILFIVQLGNPGYFDAQSGFIGNNDIRTPLWAAVIPAYDHLPVLPAAALADSAHTLTMPDDTGPGF